MASPAAPAVTEAQAATARGGRADHTAATVATVGREGMEVTGATAGLPGRSRSPIRLTTQAGNTPRTPRRWAGLQDREEQEVPADPAVRAAPAAAPAALAEARAILEATGAQDQADKQATRLSIPARQAVSTSPSHPSRMQGLGIYPLGTTKIGKERLCQV
jgi:hypothetical protein